MTCSNCSAQFVGGLQLTQDGKVVAAVCPSCLDGTLMVKISVRRPTVNAPFEYDQYSAPEVERKAVSSKR